MQTTGRNMPEEQHLHTLGYTKYKEECEDGTRITTINVSGSQCDFEYVLDMTEDHIVLIQEHWRLEEDIETWRRPLPSAKDGMECGIRPAKLRQQRMEILVDQEELLCWSGGVNHYEVSDGS
eukprot:14227076-Heterocapsa_arctica.AAC.1